MPPRTPFKSRRYGFLFALALIVVLSLAATLNHANPRYAFLGDSLTEWWRFPTVDLGIHGQTSAQILTRFPSQVAGLGYQRVYILAGTNDTLLGIDPSSTLANLDTMVTLAQQQHIEPVLAEIPPIFIEGGRYQPAVRELNTRIAALAATRHVKLVDYYDTLLPHPDGFSDGVHMRHLNYLRMEWTLLRTANPF